MSDSISTNITQQRNQEPVLNKSSVEESHLEDNFHQSTQNNGENLNYNFPGEKSYIRYHSPESNEITPNIINGVEHQSYQSSNAYNSSFHLYNPVYIIYQNDFQKNVNTNQSNPYINNINNLDCISNPTYNGYQLQEHSGKLHTIGEDMDLTPIGIDSGFNTPMTDDDKLNQSIFDNTHQLYTEHKISFQNESLKPSIQANLSTQTQQYIDSISQPTHPSKAYPTNNLGLIVYNNFIPDSYVNHPIGDYQNLPSINNLQTLSQIQEQDKDQFRILDVNKQHINIESNNTNTIESNKNSLNKTASSSKPLIEKDALSILLDDLDVKDRKEWLILETNIEQKLYQEQEWGQLLEMLSLSFLEIKSKYIDQEVLRQIAADWRQLTSIYWLASQKVKDRFRNRCGEDFDPTKIENNEEMKLFLSDYKNAQMGLLSKAENHLRKELQNMIENADQDYYEGFWNENDNGDSKKIGKPKSSDTSLSLVVFLQDFIADNITYPYMKEKQIEEVASNYLLDKQRVKRKLQNMRTRIWKPFVIEKGLVDASYFKAGNQLKKFLSTHAEEFKASNWTGMFNSWIEEKKRSNWTYVS